MTVLRSCGTSRYNLTIIMVVDNQESGAAVKNVPIQNDSKYEEEERRGWRGCVE